MFNVSTREYFQLWILFIVCLHNTAIFKLIPLLCTHVYSYMFSTVHPPRGLTLILFHPTPRILHSLSAKKPHGVGLFSWIGWSTCSVCTRFSLNMDSVAMIISLALPPSTDLHSSNPFQDCTFRKFSNNGQWCHRICLSISVNVNLVK